MTTIIDQKKRFGSGNGPAPGGAGGPGGKKGGDEAPEAGPGKKKRLLVLVLAVVVVLGLGGGAYFMFLRGPSKPEVPTGGAMVQMEAMTLSLENGHYLKIQVAVQLAKGKGSADSFGTVKISQMIIDTFSNLPVSTLADDANRKKLMADLLRDVKKEYPTQVFELYLTQFVLQ